MPRPPRITTKPKDFKKSLGRTLNYTKKFYGPMIIAIIFAIITTVITLISPNLISRITDLITQNLGKSMPLKQIISTCVIALSLYAVSAVLNYLVGFIMVTITNVVSKNLRKDISRKINVLPLSYLDSTTHGEVLSRITNDVDTVSSSLNNSLLSLVTSVLMIIGSLVAMFIKNYILALCTIATSIIGFVFVGLVMKFSQKHFVAQQRSLGQLNGHIEEIYAGHNIVKAYNGENEAKAKFDTINTSLYSSAWKSQFISGMMMPIMNFIGNLSFVVVCVVGGVLFTKGIIPSFGTITAFIIYTRLFSQPLNQLAQVATQLQSALAASERVFDILDKDELPAENVSKQITDCKGNVEFDHVRFGYTPDKVIIKDFSAKIKSGQKVAIVGPTGAGKTTLVNLLMRFYEVDSGSISIDGINTRDLSRENVHDLFSMVLQDTWIYEGSIKDNVIYSKEGVTSQEVVAACKTVGLHHFIKTLPNGYDTILDENTSISAGQKQLLTIARAMLQNSPMLILDEATSSVDTRLELLIQKAMDALTENRTSFIIAHRLSTIKNADLILVMRDGDVVEKGTHQQLLDKNGFYAELYNSQFEE